MNAQMPVPKMKRVFFCVLDSLGVGALPDAKDYGDGPGANTLGNIATAVGSLELPTLGKMGIGNITSVRGTPPQTQTIAAFGKANEISKGKDTTTGHWEFAGIEVKNPFPTYPNGFPKSFIDQFINENSLPGVLCNQPASGTQVIEDLGEEHIRTGKPIVYTSADSVFQIACHEELFGLDRLYKICENARKQCDAIQVSRVIARPFLGKNAQDFKRTGNRKDFSIALPSATAMDKMVAAGLETISIGKIASIYSHQGFTQELKAGSNREILQTVRSQLNRDFAGLVFANFVDFDMNFGHRRDPAGYAEELRWFDAELEAIIEKMTESDLLILSADHGNDPTTPGSDHTREYVPVLAYTKHTHRVGGKDLGTRGSFADIGQTMLDAFGLAPDLPIGTSFWKELE